ncbi:unnamed protein product [Colias eurytheme]|nr:unnamed protein product [Colias eurytheme]
MDRRAAGGRGGGTRLPRGGARDTAPALDNRFLLYHPFKPHVTVLKLFNFITSYNCHCGNDRSGSTLAARPAGSQETTNSRHTFLRFTNAHHVPIFLPFQSGNRRCLLQ